MEHVQVLIFDGVDELDALGPLEVLANGGLRAELVSLDGAAAVTGSHGATLVPAGPLGAPDLLVVPGGGWNDRSEHGARAEAERGDLPRAIAERHAEGTTVAAVCTGAMLVAAAGLLDGRPAITHHGAIEELRATGAKVIDDARVVDAGDVLTAAGVTSGLDLALWILSRERGGAVAHDVARAIEHEPRGRVFDARPAR